VTGAATYTIATEFGNGCSGFANCTLWTNNGVGTTTTALTFTFGFVGAQPGRWNVTARDAAGNIIPGQFDQIDGVPIPDSPSPWIYFRYSI
jgi:hypothetical protein